MKKLLITTLFIFGSIPAMAQKTGLVEKNTESHRCQYCSKYFEHHLKRHILTHTGEKPFICTVAGCGKKFTQKAGLKRHGLIHTKQSFTCTVTDCGKELATPESLARHKRTHTGVKYFVCTLIGCGKKFTQKAGLKRHECTHTGEKSCTCATAGCGKKFANPDSLARHQPTHTGEKPFACRFPGCGMKFTYLGNRTRHERIHPETKLVVCDFCDNSYPKNALLERRMQTEHPDLFEQWKEARPAQRTKRTLSTSLALQDLCKNSDDSAQTPEPFDSAASSQQFKKICPNSAFDNLDGNPTFTDGFLKLLSGSSQETSRRSIPIPPELMLEDLSEVENANIRI